MLELENADVYADEYLHFTHSKSYIAGL